MAEVKRKELKHVEQEYDWAAQDIAIHREGEKIVLPDTPVDMSYDDGIKILKRARDAENMVYQINEQIHVHFFDGLVALYRVLKDKFGYAGTQTKVVESFFGKMEIPPQLIHVRVGPKPMDVIQVPYGEFSFPNVEGTVETHYSVYKGIPVLAISGQVKSKERKVVMEIVTAVKEYAKNGSIYRGRSITLDRDESGGVDYNQPLEFFDPYAGFEVPIFNRETELLIETTMLAPIANTVRCREMKIPLKRGILLEGPYGTGKTLTARQAARVANDNGWSFIHVTAAHALKYALQFAKMYQPCVLFAEDIDRITDNRNEGANDLINVIDGIVGKSDEIITVLTTNFASKIDKSMLRPGRLDAVVSLRAPDAEATERLIRFYAGDHLPATTDITVASERLAGQIPATIREAVERSKLSMLVSGATEITNEMLEVMIGGMKGHLELLENAHEGERAPRLDEMVGSIVNKTVNKVLREALTPQIFKK